MLDSYYIQLMGKIRILVADDHPIFLEGLCRLLEDEKDLEVIAKVADGEEAVNLSKELMPDVEWQGVLHIEQVGTLYITILQVRVDHSQWLY